MHTKVAVAKKSSIIVILKHTLSNKATSLSVMDLVMGDSRLPFIHKVRYRRCCYGSTGRYVCKGMRKHGNYALGTMNFDTM